MSTFYNLPANGEKTTLLTHFAVREDGHYLYGFLSEAERFAFRQLLKVSGIGARTALSVLSGLSVGDLAAAVAQQELGRLIKVPGIGKKTAERLLLELKGKLAETTGVSLSAAVDDAKQDISNALLALGYNEKEAAAAMKQLPADDRHLGRHPPGAQAAVQKADVHRRKPQRLAQIALVALLIIGCVAVLLPMIGAVLFAFVVWTCTWPLYSEKLLPRLGGRNTLGASLMTLLLVLVMLLPMIFLVGSLASSADNLIDFVRPACRERDCRSSAPRPGSAACRCSARHRQLLAPARQQSRRTQRPAQAADRPRPASLALAPARSPPTACCNWRWSSSSSSSSTATGPSPSPCALRRRPQAGRRPRRGNARKDARHRRRRHARHRRHGGGAGYGGDARLPDRRRAGRRAARLRHLLPVDDPDRPAADLGWRRRLALQPGADRLGDLSWCSTACSSSAASTIS